ncbi:MAG: hypothetical protein EXR69_10375 [Myxococcales bacterium]|nr:hypothetical protein [Myxococcales bacterium]
MLPWLTLFACVADGVVPVSVDAPLGEVAEAEPPVFTDDVVHTVDIQLLDGGYDALLVSPSEFVQADVVIDGVTVAAVGVRIRGKIGSFRTMDGKPKFKIDFNRFVDGQRYHGLETLALNNAVVDCSYLKERTGYSVFRAAGVPAPRTAFTRVTVDGEEYGLYVVVEFPDDRFLKRWYAEPGGNLYDGKYLWYGGNDGELVDFTRALQDNFTLEEGEDVGLADIYAVTGALGGTFEALEERVDGEAFRRLLFAEQWTGHIDGYALNDNNYRVYFDPDDGRANWIPWDLDYAFLEPSDWGKSWRRPVGVVAVACWDDDGCRAAHSETVLETLEDVDPDALIDDIRRWSTLIVDDAEDDPRRECAERDIAKGQDELLTWVEERGDWMEGHWD